MSRERPGKTSFEKLRWEVDWTDFSLFADRVFLPDQQKYTVKLKFQMSNKKKTTTNSIARHGAFVCWLHNIWNSSLTIKNDPFDTESSLITLFASSIISCKNNRRRTIILLHFMLVETAGEIMRKENSRNSSSCKQIAKWGSLIHENLFNQIH